MRRPALAPLPWLDLGDGALLFGGAQHLGDRGAPGEHLARPVGAQRVHAAAHGGTLDRLRVDVLADQRADLVVDLHQLEDPDPAAIAGVVAARAALGPVQAHRAARSLDAELA